MNAKQCDRCKKFYLESDGALTRPTYAGLRTYSVELRGMGGKHIRGYDLCVDCAVKLNSFLKGSDEVPIQQPFINKPCISEGICHEDKMQVLDKLRAEIEQLADEEQKHDKLGATGLRYAIKIIDKYKESEVND